jgi:UDP-N-acetylglucosamine 2-epimerase (non-hydrolysing)
MIDTLRFNLGYAVSSETTLREFSPGKMLQPGTDYGLVTLHRPSNVDDSKVLERLLSVLGKISKRTPLIFPMHPRTEACIAAAGLNELLSQSAITTIPPQGYLEMLGLMKDAKVVLTDSGGIQEETTALGVPCITLRDNTERPITVSQGTNTVVGTNTDRILAAYEEVINAGGKSGRVPQLWDGKAAERIVGVINQWALEQN